MDEAFLAALRDRGIPDANLANMSQDEVILIDEKCFYLPDQVVK